MWNFLKIRKKPEDSPPASSTSGCSYTSTDVLSYLDSLYAWSVSLAEAATTEVKRGPIAALREYEAVLKNKPYAEQHILSLPSLAPITAATAALCVSLHGHVKSILDAMDMQKQMRVEARDLSTPDSQLQNCVLLLEKLRSAIDSFRTANSSPPSTCAADPGPPSAISTSSAPMQAAVHPPPSDGRHVVVASRPLPKVIRPKQSSSAAPHVHSTAAPAAPLPRPSPSAAISVQSAPAGPTSAAVPVRLNAPVSASAVATLRTRYDPKILELVLDCIVPVPQSGGFETICGLEHVKECFREAVILPILNPQLFSGLRQPPRGVLMYGPPGTGKTFVVKAVAVEARCSLFSVSAATIASKWHGESEKLVRCIFDVADAIRPCIVFIDEIDSLLSCRKSDEHEATRRTKTEFLVRLDGLTSASAGEESRGSVVVVGATNRPFDLDDAALRRFSRRIFVGLPSAKERVALLSFILRDVQHRLSESDLRELSLATANYSPSDIKALCMEAALQPVRDLGSAARTASVADVRPVSLSDFAGAVNKVPPSASPDVLAKIRAWETSLRSTS